MRAVVQRVKQASVTVEGIVRASIDKGLVVLVGIQKEDGSHDVEWIVKKIIKLRIFESTIGRMDRSVLEVGGDILLISQFTLLGDLKKGNRPSFTQAALPRDAEVLYAEMMRYFNEQLGHPIATGVFGSHMLIDLVNDGPVTLCLDSRISSGR